MLWGQPGATGTVAGVVVDRDGQRVPSAKVFLGGAVNVLPITAKDDGTFVLPKVPVGHAFIVAYKEADGYPYNFSNFYDLPGEQFPVVTVAAHKVTEHVVLRLGEKAAYLHLKVDDESGIPLPTNIYFWRPDHDEQRRRQSMGQQAAAVNNHEDDWDCERPLSVEQTVLVPPVPIRIAIEAAGFERWHYGGDSWQTDDGLIKLKSGETLSLSIRLHRTENQSDAEKH